jgi:hypothetical protein
LYLYFLNDHQPGHQHAQEDAQRQSISFGGVGLAATATPTTCTPTAAIASQGHRAGNIVSSATCTPSFNPDAERKEQVTPQLLAEPGSIADQPAAAQDQQQKKDEDESMAASEGEDGERQKNGHTGAKAGKSQAGDVHGRSAVPEDMRDVEQNEGKDRARLASEQAAIPRDGFNTDQHLDATMEAAECATGADPGRSTCACSFSSMNLVVCALVQYVPPG